VDSEEAAGTGKKGITPKVATQVNRNQAGLPVMSMDDIRSKADLPGKLQGGPAKQAETLGIVRVVHTMLSVKLGTVVKFCMIDEVDRNAVTFSHAVADLVDAPSHRD